MKKLFLLFTLSLLAQSGRCAPTISNIHVSQREKSNLVDIYYDLRGAYQNATISLELSSDAGSSYTTCVDNLSGDVGDSVKNGVHKLVTWSIPVDMLNTYCETMRFKITVTGADSPPGMVRIPSGTNSGTDPDYGAYSLTVSTFYMDAKETSKSQWDTVYNWAVKHGYRFDNKGAVGYGTTGSDCPVVDINYFDSVKWCNARSERDGFTPCYTTSGNIYRTGHRVPTCNFNADGYRLSTTVEWEYAARGGLKSKRFPWGNIITHNNANYSAHGNESYDNSYGTHPLYRVIRSDGSPFPIHSPVGSFPANGYGLYDMSGNVSELCTSASSSKVPWRGGMANGWASRLRIGYKYEISHRDQGWPTVGLRTVCR